MSQHELDKEIEEISWAGSKIPGCTSSKMAGFASNHLFIGAVIALRRGIAVHHAGMNRVGCSSLNDSGCGPDFSPSLGVPYSGGDPFSQRGPESHHLHRYISLCPLHVVSYYLRIIGTLALGINAPARTCVFAGDSVYLTVGNLRRFWPSLI